MASTRAPPAVRASSLNQTFSAIADHWLAKLTKDVERGKLAPATLKRTRWLLTKYFVPALGRRPIQLIAAGRGAAERDITQDLVGLLERVPTEHHAGITEPRRLGQLLRSIDRLDSQTSVGMALRLGPLVFLRPIELVTAEREDIALHDAEWRIPAERMKVRRPHLVPLSRQALEILRAAESLSRGSHHVFRAPRDPDRPIHGGAINSVLRRLGYRRGEMTAHGFRTTASNLLAELGKWCGQGPSSRK